MFRRRRDALLCAAALAAGGYASYSLYKSQSFQRRKKQLILLLDGLCKLGETASNVADSSSLLSNDLKTFLQSEDDEVPQSIKQVLKLLQCPECQELIVAVSSRVCKGMMYSISRGSSRDERGKALTGKFRLHGSHERHVKPTVASESSGDGWKRDRVEKRILHSGVFNVQGSPSRSRATGKSRHEGLPERLLTKLFSDAGKGFASAVVGSAVRNLVLSVFEQMHNSQLDSYNSDSESDRDLVPETFELGADGLVSTPVRSDSHNSGGMTTPAGWSESWKPQNLLDLACSSKGKILVAECIQLFVETAVSAYLDKTQDVNIFEELVVAVTKPTHQAPVKDLIVTVCNGAVDTLLRTSYEVLYEGSSKKMPSTGTAGRPEINDSGGTSELALGNVSSFRPPPDGVQNWVERMSTAVAIPSNRKLIIDVAGTMTSEAVRSFFDVIITVCTPYLRLSRERVHSSSVVFVGRQIRQEAVTKALIVMTVLLAVILHVIANTGLISN